MSSTLYLIDGSGYIFRAYYAVKQPLSTKSGLPTNALFGFTRMLLKLLAELTSKEEHPPRIAMVFDAGRKNFRHDMYAEYKANRSECPEDLVPQMPYFRDVSLALGFPTFELVGYEADDVIATLVADNQDSKTIVVSADKDLTQLVTDKVVTWDPMRDTLFNREKVKEQFGVFPEQIADYLSLIGDASDNIPGAKGVGPKTASQLIEHFKTLENLLENRAEIESLQGLRGAKGVLNKIESSIPMIRLSRELVALDNKVPLDVSVGEWRGFNNELLPDLLSKLEFHSLFSEFKLGDGKSYSMGAEKREKFYTEINSLEDLKAFFEPRVIEGAYLALDTETSSLDPLSTKLIGMSLSFEKDEACYISLHDKDTKPIFEYLEEQISKYNLCLAGSNLKFDLRVLSNAGWKLTNPRLFDTMIASSVLQPDGREHGLKALALKLLNEKMTSYEELTKEESNLFNLNPERLFTYACHDADCSLQLAEVLKKKLVEADPKGSQVRVFESIEMPLIPVLSRMEDRGIKVDLNGLEILGEEFQNELTSLTAEIYNLSGMEFNINSPKQLAGVLFDKLDLPTKGLKKTQHGYSTDIKTLDLLQGVHPVIDHLMEYREVFKLNSTYVQALKRLVHPKTGRIHTTFNQAIAATGRLSSSDPNLQNIPIKSDRGKRLREIFIAEEGHKLIIADYSQVELRVLAHLSGDETLIDAFRNGEDIHLRTATELFGGMPLLEEEIARQRRIAKTINFGIIYGMGPFRLAKDLGVSRREADEFIEAYFGRYPKVRLYFDRLTAEAESRGFVETLFGRRRYVSDLNMEGRDGGYQVRSMMNAPIQGTASEIVKRAMIDLDKLFLDGAMNGAMLLQVHDELIFEVPQAEADNLAVRCKDVMEEAVSLSVPVVADVHVGDNWGEK